MKAAIAFKTDPDPNAEVDRSIQIEADLGKPRLAWLAVTTSKENLSGAITFGNISSRHISYDSIFEATETLVGLNVSKQDALKTAQDTLQKMGVGEVALAYAQAGIDGYGILHSANRTAPSDPNRKKCYIFYFSRVIQGIPVTYVEHTNGIFGDDNGTKYDRVWHSELIEIAVDDSGVLWFEWLNPGEAGEMLNESVQLKNFEEIKDIFRKQMFFEKTWSVSSADKSGITIKRVVLGLMRVRMKENEYTYMPVWDFIGDWEDSGIVQTNLSLLTLNAVDGSVINRELGY